MVEEALLEVLDEPAIVDPGIELDVGIVALVELDTNKVEKPEENAVLEVLEVPCIVDNVVEVVSMLDELFVLNAAVEVDTPEVDAWAVDEELVLEVSIAEEELVLMPAVDKEMLVLAPVLDKGIAAVEAPEEVELVLTPAVEDEEAVLEAPADVEGKVFDDGLLVLV